MTNESISKKLIDAAWQWVACWQDWESRNEIDVNGPKEAFKQLAQEVEEKISWSGQMVKAFMEQQEERVKEHRERESLWRELDICYQEIMSVNYSGVSTRKIIKELRAELGLREK
jgi:hypothetical protein